MVHTKCCAISGPVGLFRAIKRVIFSIHRIFTMPISQSGAPTSKCFACGSTSFVPRINVDIHNINKRLRSDFGAAASEGVDEIISSLEKDYEDYASEISRLQLHIRFLSSQQRRVNEYQSKLRSLTSPFRKIPRETLLSIFEQVSQDNVVREYTNTASVLYKNVKDDLTATPALTLSAVCSPWCGLAMSCPSLWSRLLLVIGHMADDRRVKTVDSLAL
ncbi:hypothetical protein BDP27DRAFT_1361261 [Rhodocollybia butyracea]|uniref:F-box domain-containing protein n=1 Tax=Rhodocollybia butyracea TaxID=206335 RepID=A0A9P5UAN6_9AGAR|nr:hypothetical protein BDP27DRAFT_1361261 [Rhodocollybia butyracea]